MKLHDTIKCPCKDNPNRTGEIVFIHPDGLFCTVECTAPNGAKYKVTCRGKVPDRKSADKLRERLGDGPPEKAYSKGADITGKCVDCHNITHNVAPCGLNVCPECCITCYKQDDPCKDISHNEYCKIRNRAILRDFKAGVDMAVIEHKYGVRKETIARIRRQEKE